MKKRIVSLLLTLLTVLSLLPTAAFAAESTGVGITPVTDPNLWTTRLNSNGQSYSYRPPTAAGRQLYCMDLGYSYRYGTESFLQSYTYRSATGADADALWDAAVAETGLGEMDAITRENVKWMMSYIADYTGEIPGSLFMALQTYIWDNQSDKSAGGDPSGDIDAGGFANADTYDQYVEYYNWLLGQKANEDAELQAQVEEYAAQGIQASIVEDENSKWAVLATSSVSGRQSFFAYHCDRKIVTSDSPQPGDPDESAPPAGDGDITFQKVIAGTNRGLDGAVYNIYLDGQIVGSDVTSGGGYIEVNDVTEGLWSFVEQEAPAGYALDPTPHSVYVSVTDGDRQYTVTAEDKELPDLKIIKTDALTGEPIPNTVISVKSVTGSYSTSVSTGPDGTASLEALPAGVYVLREESVPSPYVLSHTEQTVALRPGKATEARFQDYQKPGLEILKKNIADGTPIAGVTYQIQQIDGDYSTSATTDEAGRIFLEVPVGSYEITEVNVPSHVILCEIPQTIALEAGGTQTVTFFNAALPQLTITKVEARTGTPIPGTVFTVRGVNNDYLQDWMTGDGGSVTQGIQPGVYEVTEKSVPTPYYLPDEDADRVRTISISAGENRELVFENHRMPELTIYKVDSVAGAPVEGARFHITYTSTGEAADAPESIDYGEILTDANGEIRLHEQGKRLYPGEYTITEVEPAPGFQMKEPSGNKVSSNSLPHPIFKVTAPDGVDVTELTFTNTDSKNQWTLTPLDGNNNLYRFTATGDTSTEVRVQYSDENEVVVEDDFTPETNVFKTYTISIYTGNTSGRVSAKDTNGTFYRVVTGTGTLTVRAVQSDDPVSAVEESAPTTKLASGTATAVEPVGGTTYTLNDTGVQLPEDSKPSLLFDDIIEDANSTSRTDALKDKADTYLGAASSTTRGYEIKYLDLVDANNGNAWITSSKGTDIYWAYPAGTDASTKFTLLHFEGLHRDGENSGFDIEDIANSTIERIAVTTDEYGIKFHIDAGDFSPFALVWEEASEPSTNPDPGTGSGGSQSDPYLRFDSNGGTAFDPIDGHGSAFTINPYDDSEYGAHIPSRPGYRFTGWYRDSHLTMRVDEDETLRITGSVTLFAGWAETSVPGMLNGDDHYAYIQGYADGSVRPNAYITRAQVATIFFRLLDEDVREDYLTTYNTFPDVNEDYWANTAISTMAALGVINGRNSGLFDPNAYITRAEFAAICARFDDSDVTGISTFTDTVGHWAEDEISRAAALGWIQGYSDGTFRPNQYITRAQAVTMINRVLCRLPEDADDLLSGMNTWTDCHESDWFYLAIQEATNSHDFVTKDRVYESWTGLNRDPDWSQYE